MNYKILLPFLFLLFSFASFSQPASKVFTWSDSVYNKMTMEERIAQLIIVRVPTEDKGKYYNEAIDNIEKYNVGGICFFAGTAPKQLQLTKIYQKKTKIPLLVSIDGEWGLGMRLTDIYCFPRQMMLGAIEDNSLIYQMGVEIGKQCKKMGIHINYAPVADLNSNPANPVIGLRSFGENKYKVSEKAIAYMKGLQENGTIAVAKHFPGHGDTETDSHSDLPVIAHTKAYIDSVDSYPFKALIKAGVDGVMIGHLQIPVCDAAKNSSASLSYNVISKFLRTELKFSGFIFTDGLDMKAITKYNKDGQAELKALLAGNDFLLLPEKVSPAIEAISSAAKNDTILQKIIERKCKRILQTKYRLGLMRMNFNLLQMPSYENILNAQLISQNIADQAITLVKNTNGVLPVDNIADYSIACISVENSSMADFRDLLDTYGPVEHIVLPSTFTTSAVDSLLPKLSQFNYTILALSSSATARAQQNYGLCDAVFYLTEKIQNISSSNVVLLFGTPYLVSRFYSMPKIQAVAVGYQNIDVVHKSMAQLVFGGLPSKGKLPVTAIKDSVVEGMGLFTNKTRLGYKLPRQIGLSNIYFQRIDSLVNAGIGAGAYPGCQVLVAKDGYIIHNKSYGKLTYQDPVPVTNASVYDLASLTKVCATTLVIMKLYENGKIRLDDKLSSYLSYLRNTDKSNITIRETMSHIAGFKAFYPFWRETLKDGFWDEDIYQFDPENKTLFYALTDSLYISKKYKQKILEKIAGIERNTKQEYLYSDFGFILLGDLAEKVSGKPLDVFMKENFYLPLGMNKTAFNPVSAGFNVDLIAPTEMDNNFRKSLIKGYVHDQTAAMLGGVAGHAGLFSNVSDLAALFQMLLNGGNYGEYQYLKKETIDTFNHRYYANLKNRRALGFDKPLINGKSEHVSSKASQSSFGHSGFTGTYFWVDPEYDLVYIFLSNRVYPDAENKKLAQMDIRTKIQDIIYEAVKNPQKFEK